MKDKLVSQRQAIYQQTEEDVQKRWAYEEGVRAHINSDVFDIHSNLSVRSRDRTFT